MIEWASHRKRIEETLNQVIPTSSGLCASLFEASRYSLLTPGKRIRPLLTLIVVEIFKKEVLEQALLPACALELVHTYSLIHDDLPCMDDDDFRRGMPTCHRVYGEGHAVLVGDYLLTHAFDVLSNAPSLRADQKLSLIQSLARASSSGGMIGGQIMDVENSTDVQAVHWHKTACLFRSAVEFGGIIAEVSPLCLEVLQTFGIEFGLLFQMVDDILDQDHPLGHESACTQAIQLQIQALATLKQLPQDVSSLEKLLSSIFELINNRIVGSLAAPG